MRQTQILISCILVILFIAIIGLLLKSEFGGGKTTTPATTESAPPTTTKDNSTAATKSTPSASAYEDKSKTLAHRTLGTQTLSPEETKLLWKAKDSFKRHAHPEEKIEIIESLMGIYHPDVIDIITLALNEKNEDVRLAAVELLEDFESDMIIPAVEKALDDKNATVRETAVNALMNVNTPDATNLLVRGVDDKREEVREVVFDVIEEKNPKIQEAVFAQAIHSNHSDVKERVIDSIVNIPSHNVMNILIEGMKTKDQDFKDEVKGIIEFFVSEDFDTYEDAKRWWKENKDNYDEELFEK